MSELQESSPVLEQPPSSFRPFYKRKLFILAVSLVILIVLGLGFILQATNGTDSNPLTIAVTIDKSGPLAASRKTMLDSMQLAVDQTNQKGGLNGHQVKLVFYDDQSAVNPAVEAAKQIVVSRALVEIGPNTSVSAIAAGPIYKENGFPYLLSLSSADSITQNNPDAFRTVITNGAQGAYIAAYLSKVLKISKVTMIHTPDDYGTSLDNSFEQTFAETNGNTVHSLIMQPASSPERAKSIQDIVDTLRNDPAPGMVVLGVSEIDVKDIIVPLRRAIPKIQLFGTTGTGRDRFNDIFSKYTEEQNQPGYFTEGMYALVPFILDSSSAAAQIFGNDFQKIYGYKPDWTSVKAYDTVQVILNAIAQSDIQNTPASLQTDRQHLRNQLASINSPQTAIAGIGTPIYFDTEHNTPEAARIGFFKGGQFLSAPVQLYPVSNLATVDVWKELQNNNMILVGNNYYWLQEVVYTGIQLNLISNIDVGKANFSTAFDLWFRYKGHLDPTQIIFPDAPDLPFNPASPAVSSTIGDFNYRLYHLRGDIRQNYDLHPYPFDKQTLRILFRNSQLSNERIVYVIDSFGLKPPGNLASDPSLPFKSLQSWQFQNKNYTVDNLSINSTQGDPRVFDANTDTTFSGISLEMNLSRNYFVFLVKNLLPLFLMTLVVYATLYFPPTLLKEQATVPVTAILAAAVLLNSINTQLTNIGYTVAIEYLFYIFFALCLSCMVIAILIDRYIADKRHGNAFGLRLTVRIGYPLVVVSIIGLYWLLYLK